MTRDRRHPHIANASDAELEGVLHEKTPVVREVYLATHRLMLDALPGVSYETDTVDGMTSYGSRQYGYDGWGLGAIAAHAKWVSVVFFRGSELPDPDGLLEGSGKRVRHVKVRSAEQLESRRAALRRMMTAAAGLHDDG
jgi:hypothetical protein